ncbi:MAG: DUF3362 domain-containing protein, partial [Pseudomonadota bacterium]
PMIREALQRMGKAHLIGFGKKHLVPPTQPANHPSAQTGAEGYKRKPAPQGDQPKRGEKSVRGEKVMRTEKAVRGERTGRSDQPRRGQILTQHTGLPPRQGADAKPAGKRNGKPAPASAGKRAPGAALKRGPGHPKGKKPR